MNTLNYIIEKFQFEYNENSKVPIELPNYGRNNMAELFAELKFTSGAEIGVKSGEYSEILMKANPKVKLYGIDPYIPYKGYLDYKKESLFNDFESEARKRLSQYKNYKFVKKFSLDAVSDFEENSLDFVYIDGNHELQNVINDISEWSKKVRPGGIISGHDYYNHRGPSIIHVYQAVNAFTAAWKIRPWFVLGSKEIIPGQIRDKGRSWMWIKS